MLMLIRKMNQSVMMGDEIQVKVLGINDGNVILGFKAPKEMFIHREEVYYRIRSEKITRAKSLHLSTNDFKFNEQVTK